MISPRANIPLDQRSSKPITQRFAHLVANPLRADFKFIMTDDGNAEIPAHKFIVGAASLVLDHIVYGTDGLTSVDSTRVEAITAAAFTELLRFLYTDHADITADNAVEIMIKANYYDIQQLELMCVRVLLASINRDHCCAFYSRLFAYFSYNAVVKKCLEFIQFAPDATFKHAEFVDLDVAAVKEILKFDAINCTELQLVEACKDWANAQCERNQLPVNVANLRRFFDDLLPLLRLTTMTPNEYAIVQEMVPDLWTASEVRSIREAIATKKTNQVRRDFFTFQDTTWVEHHIDDPLPADAVYVGFDNGRAPIYLGRAHYGGVLYPLEIIPTRQSAHFFIDDMRRDVEYFDVLCGSGYEWVRTVNGKIPVGTVVADNGSHEEPVYIGRGTSYNDFLTIGRVDVAERCIFVSDFNSEIEYEVAAFDVLVGRNVQHAQTMDAIPATAIVCGQEDTDDLYVGQAFYEGLLLPAQIAPKRRVAMVVHDRAVHEVDKYVYVCGPAEWLPPCATATIPENAIVGGYAADVPPESSRLYIGRGVHNGHTLMGMTGKRSTLLAAFNGQVVELNEFSLLVRK